MTTTTTASTKATTTVDYRVDDKVAYITLNRPDKLNAINAEMRRELFRVFEDVKYNPDIWLAVLAGEGRAFCVGHDLTEMSAAEDTEPSTDDLYLYELSVYKPVIVSINGYCLAQGAGLALCGDVRIASDRAQFGWPQVKRGIASISGPSLLAQYVPMNVALELLYTGEMVSAQRALELHLVNRVVPHDDLARVTQELVQQLRANAPLPMRAMKEAALRGQTMQMPDRVRFSSLLLKRINQTADAKEGLSAFQEKRQPTWRGE
jgi:E-phenylitaconyl-CoA hydratase